MADVIIHGFAPSSYVRATRMACWEKGITHTLVDADIRADDYPQLHPFRKVPVLDHGDVRMYETTAILRYVDEAFAGPRLQPTDVRERAEMERWLSILNCYLYQDAVRDVVLQYVSAKGPDAATVEAARPRVRRDLALLEQRLANRAWIAGDALSLADLALAPVIASLGQTPARDLVADHPNLGRWLGTIAARDSFRQAHAGLQG